MKLEELTVRSRNAQREVEIKIDIADISRLPEADFFTHYGFSLARISNGDYVFYNRPITTEPPDGEWNPKDTEVYKLLAPLLGGFRFQLELRVPGLFKRNNATRKSGSSVAWTFDFDSDSEALSKLQRSQMKAVFDGDGFTLAGDQAARPRRRNGTGTRR